MADMQTTVRKKYVAWLAGLLLLFGFRVVAQLVQKFYSLGFLPPFDAWQSGVLPYPILVAFQVIIILICTNFVVRFARGKATRNPIVGVIYMVLGSMYFSVMLFRLVVGLTFASEHSWFSVRIPTGFHLVLASFLLSFGRFYHKEGKENRGK